MQLEVSFQTIFAGDTSCQSLNYHILLSFLVTAIPCMPWVTTPLPINGAPWAINYPARRESWYFPPTGASNSVPSRPWTGPARFMTLAVSRVPSTRSNIPVRAVRNWPAVSAHFYLPGRSTWITNGDWTMEPGLFSYTCIQTQIFPSFKWRSIWVNPPTFITIWANDWPPCARKAFFCWEAAISFIILGPQCGKKCLPLTPGPKVLMTGSWSAFGPMIINLYSRGIGGQQKATWPSPPRNTFYPCSPFWARFSPRIKSLSLSARSKWRLSA